MTYIYNIFRKIDLSVGLWLLKHLLPAVLLLICLGFVNRSYAVDVDIMVNAMVGHTGEADQTELYTDSGADPATYTTGADGFMFVDKGDVLSISAFDLACDYGTITAVSLMVQYSVEAGYAGSNAILYNATTTGIVPTDGQTDFSASFDLYGAAIDTWAEINTLAVTYTNDDGGGADGVSFDYIWVRVTYTPAAKSVSSITYNQASTADVYRNGTDQEILRIDVDVAGSGGTLNLNSLEVTSNNTADGDIASSGVKLYRTSTTTFSTANPLGTAQTFSGGTATFSSIAYDLPGCQITYLWVVYDIKGNAVIGNDVDAKVAANGIDIAGSTYPAAEESPAGVRPIVGVTYCPSTSTSCAFEYITDVSVPDFSNTTVCSNYTDYSSLGPIISAVPGASFTLTVSHNRTFSTDKLYIYADWNADGNFTLCNSKEDYTTLASAQSYDLTINVPGGAVTGITTLRVKFGDGIDSDPCQASFTDGEVEDYSVFIYADTGDMEFFMTTISQNSNDVAVGTYNMDIIGICILVSGIDNPASLTKLTVNFNGTTVVGDIENATIYYTAASPSYAATSAFGSIVAAPTTTNFDISGNKQLAAGPNYFWLACDIKSTAGTDPNVVDAECIAAYIDDAILYPPIVTTAPAGSRLIQPTWTYCTVTGVDNTDQVYISDFVFNQISNTTDITGTDNYNDYTAAVGVDTAIVQRESAYPISITVKSYDTGVPNTGAGAYGTAWIDYNNDGDFDDSGEKITEDDGVTNFTNEDNIVIPDDATIGYTRMRVIGSNTDAFQCGENLFAEIEDYTVQIIPADTMEYYTITVEQNSADVVRGLPDRWLLRITVATEGSLLTDTITKFTVNVNGTINLADIENAKIYYTGTVNEFGTQALLGTIVSPTTTNFDIVVDQKLIGGTSFFWLSVDVVAGATLGNFVDGECSAVYINEVAASPAPTPAAPAGDRLIIDSYTYCLATGDGQTPFYIDNVTFNTISNLATGAELPSADNYIDYTGSQTTTVNQGLSYNLQVDYSILTSYSWTGAVWIDWNLDGDWYDTGEELATVEAGPGETSMSINVDVTIPASSNLGTSRMRVVLQYAVNAMQCYDMATADCEDYEVIISSIPDHCYNEVQDVPEGETDVDCGGPCPPCHCFNGVQDSDNPADPDYEEGIDCGGPDCEACGSGCGTAFQVPNPLPFVATDLTTCNNAVLFDEDDVCGSSYANGQDYLFTYTPSATGWVDIDLTLDEIGYTNGSGLYVMSACPSDIDAECLAMNVKQFPLMHSAPHIVMEMSADSTYYILVTNGPDPHVYAGDPCLNFDIAITDIAMPTPTVQDAFGATAICDQTYNENGAYSGQGNYPSEINHVSSCTDGELNNMWYILTVSSGGTIEFNMNPLNTGEDYDWSIYNITNNSPADIFSEPGMEVSCNYAAPVSWPPPVQDNTGLAAGYTETSQGPGGTLFNAPINAATGDVYLLMISHWNDSPSGYHLDFTGTAVIDDTTIPALDAVTTEFIYIGDGTFVFEFSENVLCSSVTAADFTIDGLPGDATAYTVTSVTSDICDAGGTSARYYTINFTPSFVGTGTYNINLVGGVEDQCGNVSTPATVPFAVCPDDQTIWTGATSTDWFVQSNWDCGLVPTSTIDAIIPAAGVTNEPNIAAAGAECKDLNIEAGRTLTINSDGTLDIYGDLTNNAAISHTAGTVTMMSSSNDQSIGGSSAISFYKLTINNTGFNVNLATPVTIANTLTLTDGNLNTDATNILTINDDAKVGDGSAGQAGNANSFVDGPIRKIGDDEFTFPTGEGTHWARIGITAPSVGTDRFDAEYNYSAYGNLTVDVTQAAGVVLNNVSSLEHWILDRAIGASEPQITLYWEDAAASGIDDCTDLRIAHYDIANAWWENNNDAVTTSGSCTGAVSGSIQTDAAVTEFSPFTFSSKQALINLLPVELVRFNAICQPDRVKVFWTSSAEINNDYFSIERSEDGVEYEVIDIIKGAGNSNDIKYYEAYDNSPLNGIAYYRLKQTDHDGRMSVSKVITVDCKDLIDFAIYPNPVKKDLDVYFTSGIEEEVTIRLFEITGKQILEEKYNISEGNFFVTLDVSTIAKGMYFLTLTSDHINHKEDIIKE